MNPNEMSLEACRDWLADDVGWFAPRKNPRAPGNAEWTLDAGSVMRLGGWYIDEPLHPIPPTLDAIAACMPEGLRVRIYLNNSGAYCWAENPDGSTLVEIRAPTELLARARLCVACWMAEKEKP